MMLWKDAGLQLTCFPEVPEHVAKPWDAGDEFIFRTVPLSKATLVINDRHGALSCLLEDHYNLVDSACAIQAIERNRSFNTSNGRCQIVTHEDAIPADIQQAVIKIPKNLEQLKFWLSICSQRLIEGGEIWLAGMAKHIPVAWLQWLEANSDSYEQYRIEKKARLLKLTNPVNCKTKPQGYQFQGLNLTALPGVFSRNKLDIGSQSLLPHLGIISGGTVADIGCGNGLLSLVIKRQCPDAQLIACDDSMVAVRSAADNAEANNLDIRTVHSNALDEVGDVLDWVVCNPPYHDGHKELTNIAATMFKHSASKLKSGGRLLVVANRHLPYEKMLRRLFPKVEIRGRDSKFNVYLCQKAAS